MRPLRRKPVTMSRDEWLKTSSLFNGVSSKALPGTKPPLSKRMVSTKSYPFLKKPGDPSPS